jgi:transposase-like protein
MKKKRRNFTGPEKVAVLKRHLLEKVPISDLCDELDLFPNQLYAWLKDLFENGHRAFDNPRNAKALDSAKDLTIQKLQDKLTRKNEVLAQLLEEHTLLKKELGEI